MNFIDTHSHIYAKEFELDIENVIKNATNSGISKILMPSIDKSNFAEMDSLVSKYPELLYPLIGVHPTSIKEKFEDEIEFVENQLKKTKYIGIGEIGIDLYWDKTFLKQQIEAFEMQIKLAIKYDLPIVIHQRESFNEIFNIIDNPKYSQLRGIFHCFAGDLTTAKKCIDKGFLLGIGGVVTYKNSLMAEIVKDISLDYLVLETDAPYLPPVPYRGKRNEPSYIPIIARKVAEIKNCDIEEVAQKTTLNAIRLFNL